MRRADRLFQIVQSLRRRKVTTAGQLARELEVSERTIYRDVQDLVRSGVPISGEAGVGYALPRGFDLPPLTFTEEEIESLVLGARLVQSWSDPGLAQAAKQALQKIEAALPERLKPLIEGVVSYAPSFHITPPKIEHLGALRAAIRGRQVLHIRYSGGSSPDGTRDIRPLGLFFWGARWSLLAWCELRQGFRNFRVDRIVALTPTGQVFTDQPGQTLEDFFLQVSG
jgi:predicted DNA-binding transcriptional regulator YafY